MKDLQGTPVSTYARTTVDLWTECEDEAALACERSRRWARRHCPSPRSVHQSYRSSHLAASAEPSRIRHPVMPDRPPSGGLGHVSAMPEPQESPCADKCCQRVISTAKPGPSQLSQFIYRCIPGVVQLPLRRDHEMTDSLYCTIKIHQTPAHVLVSLSVSAHQREPLY